MIGAVIGDTVGSYYAERPTVSRRIELTPPEGHFTQNTVFLAAHCELLYYADEPAEGRVERMVRARETASVFKKYAARYPELLGTSEKNWAAHAGMSKSVNISAAAAVAALPCAYICESAEQAADQSELACKFLFNTEASRACARAVSAAVFMLGKGEDIGFVRGKCEELSGIDLSRSYDEISDGASVIRSPQDVAAAAFAAFFDSEGFAGALKNACRCVGETHIISAIAGALAQAYYKSVPEDLKNFALSKLDDGLLKPIDRFLKKIAP